MILDDATLEKLKKTFNKGPAADRKAYEEATRPRTMLALVDAVQASKEAISDAFFAGTCCNRVNQELLAICEELRAAMRHMAERDVPLGVAERLERVLERAKRRK